MGTRPFLKYRQRWSASFDCTAESDGHTDSIILSSAVTYSDESGQFQLVTGANDGYIKVFSWRSLSNSSLTFLRYGISSLLNLGTIWTLDSTVQWLNVMLKAPMVSEIDLPQLFSLILFLQDTMLYALSKFVSIPSVSNSPQHREDCRQGAIWLKKCLSQLGASQSTLVGNFHPLGAHLLTFQSGINWRNN